MSLFMDTQLGAGESGLHFWVWLYKENKQETVCNSNWSFIKLCANTMSWSLSHWVIIWFLCELCHVLSVLMVQLNVITCLIKHSCYSVCDNASLVVHIFSQLVMEFCYHTNTPQPGLHCDKVQNHTYKYVLNSPLQSFVYNHMPVIHISTQMITNPPSRWRPALTWDQDDCVPH